MKSERKIKKNTDGKKGGGASSMTWLFSEQLSISHILICISDNIEYISDVKFLSENIFRNKFAYIIKVQPTNLNTWTECNCQFSSSFLFFYFFYFFIIFFLNL